MSIRFGTSGRRAFVANDFTFAGVRKVTAAVCAHGAAHEVTRSVVIGHDTRFLGERFPAASAAVISSQGFCTLLCSQPTPTPTISHAIRTERAICGNNSTASHNPPEYAGMKLATADGGPALPVYETPAGFKYIGELINEDKIILGGEASAGLSIKGQYPEKDGILACLLAAEAVAARGASLTQQLDALYTGSASLSTEGSICG